MIPHLPSVERWHQGKFELRFRAFGMSGAAVADYKYGKIKRKKFINKRWHTVNTFVSRWTEELVGDYMVIHWTEEDGGRTCATVNISFENEDTEVTTEVSFDIKGWDEDLGFRAVQFSDPMDLEYSTGEYEAINWFMEN